MFKPDKSHHHLLPTPHQLQQQQLADDIYNFPSAKEKPTTSKTPQSAKSETKTLKRKLNFSPAGTSEDESEKRPATTPKRRRSLLSGESSPNPGATTPKSLSGSRLTERQQMALLMQMTAGENTPGQGSGSGGEMSPRPSSPHSSAHKQRTPLEKKVNKRNERGETSLHVAAIRGDYKQIKRLIKAGADVNVADFAGWTAIHEACNHGHLVVAKQLLKCGANVNVQGMDNDTPLHDAAINGHRKLVELLLRHGANPLQSNTSGNSPLDVAQHDEIRKLLRNEILASSSSSSSLDEVRSPTSPESNASEKGDHSPCLLSKKLDKDTSEALPSMAGVSRYGASILPSNICSTMGPLTLGIPSSTVSHSATSPRTSSSHHSPSSSTPQPLSSITSASSTSSAIFKKVLVSHHMDKSSSPRLTIKFQHIKKDSKRSVSPKRLRPAPLAADSQFKSYSVTLGARGERSEYDQPISPTGSATSQENDPYQSQQETTSYGSKRSHPGASLGYPGSQSMGSLGHPGTHTTASLGHPSSSISLGTGSSSHPVTSSGLSMGPSGHTVGSSCVSIGSLGHSVSSSGMPMGSLGHHMGPSGHTMGPSGLSVVSQGHTAGVQMSSSIGKESDSKVKVDSSQDVEDYVPGSQESGPFEPQFEDISDEEDGSHELKPTTQRSFPSKHLQRTTDVGKHLMRLTDVSKHLSRVADVSSSSDIKSNPSHSPTGSNPRKNDKSDVVAKPLVSSAKEEWRESPPQSSSLWKDEKMKPKPTLSTQMKVSAPSVTLLMSHQVPSPHVLLTNTNPTEKLTRVESKHSPTGSESGRVEKLSPKSDSESGKVEQDKFVVRPDSDNTRSPTFDQSPKSSKDGAKARSENRTSPKPDRDSRDSRDSWESPKSDKDGKQSVSSSPKVPPLKIIMPTKTVSEKVQPSLKMVTSRSSLPYVLNPTQDGEHGCTLTLTQATSLMDPMTTTFQQHSSILIGDSASFSLMAADNLIAPGEEPPMKIRRNSKEDKLSDDGTSECAPGVDPDEDKEGSRDSSGSGGDRNQDGHVERRVTRSSVRSQQKKGDSNGGGKEDSPKEASDDGNVIITRAATHTKQDPTDEAHILPRKRKFRQQRQQEETNTPPPVLPPHHMEKPTNPYELYLDIRKTISSRHKSWFVVQPKAPHGFDNYLMVSCNYLLKGNTGPSRLCIPMLTPPSSLGEAMEQLFIVQEKARYKLKLQHVIEREKLVLSIEQEILRVHGRAARAMANQSMPLSVCAILRDQDVYNTIDPSVEDRDKNIRSRYNGRQFCSWLRDVDDKYEKIKEALLLRHHHEVESLNAVQKLEWEWKLRETGQVTTDFSSHPVIDELHVPMITVNDNFDLLPS